MRPKFVVLLGIDLALIVLATISALALRENLEIARDRLEGLLPYLGVTLTVAAPVLVVCGLNRSIWRLSVMSDYVRIIFVVTAIVATTVGVAFLYNRLDGVARSIPLLQALLMIFALVGARVLS